MKNKELQILFKEIADKHSPIIYKWAYKKLGDRYDAEDLSQEVILQVLFAIKKMSDKGITIVDLDRYVWKVAFYTWSNYLSRVNFDKKFSVFDSKIFESTLFTEEEDTLMLEEEIQKNFAKLKLSLSRLNPVPRKVIIMHYLEECSIKEIASTLNLSTGCVKTHLFRARAELREDMSKIDEASVELCETLLTHYEYDIAIAKLTEIINILPNHIPAYIWRANGYLSKYTLDSYPENLDKSNRDIHKALQLCETSPHSDVPIEITKAQAYYVLGRLHYVIEDIDGAIKYLTQSIELAPDYIKSYIILSFSFYTKKKDIETGLMYVNKSLEIDPTCAIAYMHLANVNCLKDNDAESALKNYTKGIELEPHNVLIYLHRAFLFESQNELDKAIADFDQTTKINPYFSDAFYYKACFYLNKKKDIDLALINFDNAIKINPHKAEWYYQRAIVYIAKNDKEKAIKDLEKAISMKPENEEYKKKLDEIRS